MTEIRALGRAEVADVWTIDRAESIDGLYRVERGELVLRPTHEEVPGWPAGQPAREGAQLLDCFDHGGSGYGAFDAARLVGAGVLESRFIGRQRDQLQLKFLYVSRDQRGTGLGRRLFEACADRARELGARQLYVSATPSRNTVGFYLGLGCRLCEEVDPVLFELEPEDIHLTFGLSA